MFTSFWLEETGGGIRGSETPEAEAPSDDRWHRDHRVALNAWEMARAHCESLADALSAHTRAIVNYPPWAQADRRQNRALEELLKLRDTCKARLTSAITLLEERDALLTELERKRPAIPEGPEPTGVAEPTLCYHCGEEPAFVRGLCTPCYRYTRTPRHRGQFPPPDLLQRRRLRRNAPLARPV